MGTNVLSVILYLEVVEQAVNVGLKIIQLFLILDASLVSMLQC
jgi:hypothetical protein